MKYSRDLHNKEWFLQDPRTRKWIVQCSRCQEYGRHPDAPELPKAKFEDNFRIMHLDDKGLCDECHAWFEKSSL